MKKFIILVLLLNKVSITGRIGDQSVKPSRTNIRSNTDRIPINKPKLIPDQLNTPDDPLAKAIAKSVNTLIKTENKKQVLDYLRMKCQDSGFKLPKKVSSQLKECGIISHHNENMTPKISKAIKRYMQTPYYFGAIIEHQKQKLKQHIQDLNPAKRAHFEQSIRERITRNQNR